MFCRILVFAQAAASKLGGGTDEIRGLADPWGRRVSGSAGGGAGRPGVIMGELKQPSSGAGL